MSVIFKAGERSFKASEILWAKRELIDAIVEQALLNQTEGFIEMIMDGEKPADITRDSVNNILRGVKDSAEDFLNDMIGDLQHEVKRRLEAASYGASVTGIKYDLAGDVTDIEVDVSVSFE
jgi:hypothetical protein